MSFERDQINTALRARWGLDGNGTEALNMTQIPVSQRPWILLASMGRHDKERNNTQPRS